MGMNYAGKTDIGKKRDNNQDCFLIKEINDELVLFTVCDGMGGAAGGSTASTLCAETFMAAVCEKIVKNDVKSYILSLQKAVARANEKVYALSVSDKSLSGMGTTIVSCLCDKEKYYLCWVGDSRIYAVKDGKLTQLSHDHSFVQTLVDNGSINEAEAKVHPNRNIITRAVGIASETECDVMTVDRSNMDGILLCSDGLSTYVEKEQIEDALRSENNVQKLVQKLVELANDVGGHDNITVILQSNK